MPENPHSRQIFEKNTRGVAETATELASAAAELLPDGVVDAALEMGGSLLEGAVEVGKSVVDNAGDILGDAL